MTVREMIEFLQTCDQNASIRVWDGKRCGEAFDIIERDNCGYKTVDFE